MIENDRSRQSSGERKVLLRDTNFRCSPVVVREQSAAERYRHRRKNLLQRRRDRDGAYETDDARSSISFATLCEIAVYCLTVEPNGDRVRFTGTGNCV
ncbi:hypothetical protein [Bradyrhizobium macuxiense]|uniref:hypothetical protein n=1 Tax=Bradyrhizobium macuxiense TaxID=1755647 RepID=UPI0011BEE540|nr:hypothetical protein [Bradyrhizobium macuxiense]